MGPVTLNKDCSINKAGIEVNVIPIMKSPCPSPQPKRKKIYRRPHSELGFHKHKFDQDDSGSLPDLKRSSKKGSLLDTIIKMNPDTFLSTESLDSGSRMSRSSGGSYRLTKGAIMNAVVDWLEKASPFGSAEVLDQPSMGTSIADITDTSLSIFEDDDFDSSHEKSISKSEKIGNTPDIIIFSEENTTAIKRKNITSSHLGK